MTIRLTRIYTRGGDKGTTALVGGARVPKESLRLEAYGTVDELNSAIGVVRTFLSDYEEKLGSDFAWYEERLRRIQNELFDVGSELATPPGAEYDGMFRFGTEESRRLEVEMDRMQQALAPLNSFTLPGGGKLNAFLHQAHGMPSRRAPLLETQPRRTGQSAAARLSQPAERSSVRAVAMDFKATR
jgi:cob(I)alamin adenosyltransferase